MEHLLEILKIVDGAVNADSSKVFAYTKQLAKKLEDKGDEQAASRLLRALAQGKVNQLNMSSTSLTRQIPVDSESRISLADEEVFEPKQDIGIFLEDSVQDSVEEFLAYLTVADRLIAAGVGISPSLLAYGPPGCGKTELGRYVAQTLKLPLLTARTDSLISSFLGNTAKNLRVLFEHAMARPCVLFLDEFDALAKLRDDQYEVGELKRVVVSLLQNIDALDNQTVLLAATNHEHLLDTAIWRRFAYHVHLDIPNSTNRTKIFRKFLSDFVEEKELKMLSDVSEGLNGSQIRQVSEDGKRQAVLSGASKADFQRILLRIAQILNPTCFSGNMELSETLKSVRGINKKVFTYRRLSEMFDISLGHVSHLLKGVE